MSIVLEHLVKSFAGHPVVGNVSLEIPDGELFVLLGPSGSGKSTILRLIAGLLAADGGRILLQGRDVTALKPQRRGVGFVFQHYALFRHLTVAANVEFALKIRRMPRGERRRRREELLELVGLVGLGGRYPQQLSGGQQQRVALARALAHQPQVLLLDEPFGALDAKIRTDLRRSLRRIQQELGITAIFVTHDQEEAFELGDRIGVMNFGRLLEVGPPEELYLRPQTEFAAMFLGKANLMVGELSGGQIHLGRVAFPLDVGGVVEPAAERRVQVLFRPEDVAVAAAPHELRSPALGEGEVEEIGFSGSFERIRLRLPHLAGVRAIAPAVPYGAHHLLIEAVRSQDQARTVPLRPGDPAWVGLRRVHALAHPGLAILVLIGDDAGSRAALDFTAELARLAHARVTVLAAGAERPEELLQRARERIGSGPAALDVRSASEAAAEVLLRETESRSYDLAVHGQPAAEVREFTERVLDGGGPNLLWVPRPAAAPRRALICVAVGEPGKADIQFAARLIRHLGAAASLLTVLPKSASAPAHEQAQRFLAAGVHTLSHLDVEGQVRVGAGRPAAVIRGELEQGQHDLLVLGAPLPRPVPDGRRSDRPRRGIRIDGLVGDLLAGQALPPVLIVRPPEELATSRPRPASTLRVAEAGRA